MGCYCGCDTKANRIKFVVSGILFALGFVVFFSFGFVESSCITPKNIECMQMLQKHDKKAYEDAHCIERQEEQVDCIQQRIPALLTLELAWVVLWVAALIPMCMLCCCTRNPHQAGADGVSKRGGMVYAPLVSPKKNTRQFADTQPLLLDAA